MNWGVRWLVVFVAVASFGAVGCSQSFLSGESSSDNGESESADEDSRRRFVLVPAGPEDLNVGVEQTGPLKVFLYKKSSGEPVQGRSVEFSAVEGGERGSLSARRATTNENGAASIEFRAGDAPGTSRVVASHPGAEDVSFSIQVDPVPSGGLELKLVNTGSGVMPLTDIGVRLYDADNVTCEEFRALADRQPDALRAKSRPEAGTTATFGNLPVENAYTVTATARGNRGQIAAGGCLGDVRVPEEKVLQKELLLHLVPLDPAGRYRATTVYDFSKAIRKSGAVGKTISRVFEIVENPAQELYKEMVDLIEGAVGDLAGKGIEWVLDQTGLDDQFKGLIRNAFENNETLCKIREVGRDLRAMATHLRVDSELTIGNLRSDYEFQGRNNWTTLTVYWRGKCGDHLDEICSGDTSGSDERVDRMKPCAAVRLTPDQSDEVENLGVWSSQWKGRVTNYNRLEIDRHPVPLRYGRLLSYLLDQVILPDLTDGNANSLEGAIAYWIGCDSLGNSVTGSDGEVCAPDPVDACLTANDISGFCESSVQTIFGAADFLIGRLELDTGIYVGGEGTLVETTSDAKVDYIEQGTYDGYIEINKNGLSQDRAPVTGEWSAERTGREAVTNSD